MTATNHIPRTQQRADRAARERAKASSKVNHPSHYLFKCRTTEGVEVQLEAADIMEALFSEDIHLAQAWKYMERAGKKGSSSYVEDVAKANWWLSRAIRFHGGHPEVD